MLYRLCQGILLGASLLRAYQQKTGETWTCTLDKLAVWGSTASCGTARHALNAPAHQQLNSPCPCPLARSQLTWARRTSLGSGLGCRHQAPPLPGCTPAGSAGSTAAAACPLAAAGAAAARPPPLRQAGGGGRRQRQGAARGLTRPQNDGWQW